MKHLKNIALILIALIIGFTLRGCFSSPTGSAESQAQSLEPKASPSIFTCSMHPQFQLPEMGKCPICFMDLIPLEAGGDEGGERELVISEYSARLMELETSEVVRRFAETEIRLVGKVETDETRLATISAWFPGRIDRLFVDYTGMSVSAGDHLAELYSPDLLTAQEELLQALEAREKLKENSGGSLLETAEQTIISAREKLRLWGFSPQQIKEIETRGTAVDRMTIHAPVGGIVIRKNVQEGDYLKTGSPLITIADLSTVWVQLNAYESDLNGLRYGSRVEFTSESHPGHTFSGIISFIDPIIQPATRTAEIRVIADNTAGRLKPGMFVRAVVRSRISEEGHVVSPDLAGKWISPMHPEIVKNEPGACDVCGMALVPAESLGHVAEAEESAPLLIPAGAVLKTGKRAVVYLEIPDREKPTYEGRDITLGPRFGNYYAVVEGLEEGDRVVTRGAFKIDAELQIQAKPSMMNPEGGTLAHAHHGGMDHGSMEMKPQTSCPVMGGAINKEVYADHNGMRIYFCCPGCDATFKADPDKYVDEMRTEGIEPEKLPGPQTFCPIMGNPINNEVYVDHNGMRIYFCCPGCDSTFKEEPDKYIQQMKDNGVKIETVEQHHDH